MRYVDILRALWRELAGLSSVARTLAWMVSEGWLAIRSALTIQASEGWYQYGDLRKVGA